MAEQRSGEPGSLGAGSDVPHWQDTPSASAAASAPEVASGTPEAGSPTLAPEQGAAAEADAPKVDAPKPDAPLSPGKLMIMSADDGSWDRDSAGPEAETGQGQGIFEKRRLAALAAVVALATGAGVLGGALATAGLLRSVSDDGGGNRALESSVARIDANILALKANVENTAKLGMSQYNKTSDRLDKVEKAQAEPAAKLAKLSEAVEKLRTTLPVAAAPVAAVPVAAKDVTGSIAPPATASASAPAAAPKVEVGRLPTVEGWVLRDVANGGALIEGRQGIYEVYAGDPVPGLGRIDAIRRQDGRWVVVTSKGLVVSR